VLRRTVAEETPAATLQAGNLDIDFDRRLFRRDGEVVHLTPKEFDLLALLMRNQGMPLTHAKLLRAVWGPEYGKELEYLRSYVKTLRKKIEADPAKPKYILTERGWVIVSMIPLIGNSCLPMGKSDFRQETSRRRTLSSTNNERGRQTCRPLTTLILCLSGLVLVGELHLLRRQSL
jgi:DNA-binding winged helix-turn-helix (wHTH) protein